MLSDSSAVSGLSTPELAVNAIVASIDLHIPGELPSLPAAIAWVHDRVITMPHAVVRIRIADGDYALGAGDEIIMRHPQGTQVQILGNLEDPSRVRFRVAASQSQHFLAVANGYELGKLDGLTIEGTGGWLGHGAWDEYRRPYGCGVLNDGGGTVNVGSKVHIERMYYGLRAEKGGRIICDPGVRVNEAGDAGFHAFNGGHIEASRTVATNCAHASAGLGCGYLAELGGTIKAEFVESSGNALAGVAAVSNGSVWAQNAKVRRNWRYGFWAENQGHVIATSDGGQAEAAGNREGFRAGKGGTIECPGGLAHGNSRCGYAANAGAIDATGAVAHENGSAASAVYGGVIYGLPQGRGNAQRSLADATSIIGADPLA